jgi:hypothetical protein
MLTKLEIQLYSIVHTLALTQRAQTQDKCNALIRGSYSMLYSKSWVRINCDSSKRRNFDQDKKNETRYHSWKEHLKMNKNAKFGCELL